ncbi:hypothetical protein SCUCBS95973_009417 [Sporothrix curviconia]|uniref:Uncharacterized protein n=1 Tax=Sporothrix curviconia TaxID=1260050 RepID=A0ABP0CUS3_9PEZI
MNGVHKNVKDLLSLDGKTFAITGGARGLGITLAGAVLEAGGNVACLDILPAPVESEWVHVATLAKNSGVLAVYFQCDITDEAAVSDMLDKIVVLADKQGAPFSGSIACAGIQQKFPALNYPIDMFEKMMKVNVTGTFITAKQTARQLVKADRPGSIMIVASMSGQIANRGLDCTAYNSSKAALQQMCRSVAQEWGQYGIRVNTLSPGYIRTAMTDMLLEADPALNETWMRGALLGRLGVPDDFKAVSVFLLSEGSSFVTGADFRVDGGHCASA